MTLLHDYGLEFLFGGFDDASATKDQVSLFLVFNSSIDVEDKIYL